MGRLNLADWIDCTDVEGPGKRFALWVQGCTIQCPECCNPHMFDLVPKLLVDASEVISWIIQAQETHHIEGVTFLGGEPMLQARGLAEVAAGVRNRGLSVMVFTGFTLEHLQQHGLPGVNELLASTDVLVDGPFVVSKPESKRNWVGSTNQRIHFFSNRYNPGIEFDPAYSHGFELRIFSDGTLRSNGWPSQIAESEACVDLVKEQQKPADRSLVNQRWVVIEGDNGTGKDTLADQLAEMGFAIVNRLTAPKSAESHARSLCGRAKVEAFLNYNQICATIAETQSVPALQIRYWPSTLAGAYADEIMPFNEIHSLAMDFITKRLMPRLTIYLKCNFEERIKRIAQRGAIPHGDDITKRRSRRHEEAMCAFSESVPEWITIDCTRVTPEGLFQLVFHHIKSQGMIS